MAHILIFIHWFVLVFTFGNVELVTIDNSKSNDVPIVELNNYTLREVFEVGNLILNPKMNDNLNAYSYFGTKATWVNGRAYLNRLQDDPIVTLSQQFSVNTNDLIYTSVDFEIINNNSIGLYGIMYNENPITYVINMNNLSLGNYTKSIIYNSVDNYLSLYANTNVGGTEYYTDNWYAINMTTLDISSLSLERMDYWFNVYQENAQREISETYDYIENELTTNDLIYIVLFALLWGLAIKIVKGVM